MQTEKQKTNMNTNTKPGSISESVIPKRNKQKKLTKKVFQQGETAPTKSYGFLDNVQMGGGGSFSIQNIILQISFCAFSEKICNIIVKT